MNVKQHISSAEYFVSEAAIMNDDGSVTWEEQHAEKHIQVAIAHALIAIAKQPEDE